MESIWEIIQHEPDVWLVIDEDGEQIEFFKTRKAAEEWLDFQMAAAEMAAEGDR